MKKWLYLAAAIAAIAALARLPHPAKDISKLEPVALVFVSEERGILRLETDTGEQGRGKTLTDAQADLLSKADGAIFLETAQYLLLDPTVAVTEDFFRILRPGCRVYYTKEKPDLPAAAKYLSAHPPKLTLAQLRAAVK